MTADNETQELQRNFERIGNLLRHELREALNAFRLQPIQFEVLHYLARCNRYSDTPMAVTDYLGQTKGTVSQTLKVLEKNSLIEKKPDTNDKRVVHLNLTAAGQRILDRVYPSRLFDHSVAALSRTQIQHLNHSLVELLRTLQTQNGRRSFGQCFSCQHHIKLGNNKFQCGLTGEPLKRQDIDLICREHADAA